VAQLKLIGGFYQAKSLIANAQRCVNLYPEQNPEDSPFPYTTYPTPGLQRLPVVIQPVNPVGTTITAQVRDHNNPSVVSNALTLMLPPATTTASMASAPGGNGQGVYCTTKGDLFAACGGILYYVNPAFQFTPIATVDPHNPVSMADNADAGAMIVVDGTARGLIVNLTTRVATVISDPAFYGSTRVDFVDGYFVLNYPGNNQFYISNAFSTTFNPLYFAGKTGGGDPIVVAVCLHREIWLLGQTTSEVWDNTGATDFPYQPLQGVFIQHGIVAPYSVATQDLSIYWLGQNKQGQGIVLRGNGYQAKRISTHAVESEIQSYSTITDARAFIYQQEGHVFYVLNFPTAGATWVFDEATGMWHERAELLADGSLGQYPINSACVAYGINIFQDAQDGSLYTPNLLYGQLDLAAPRRPEILHIRSFPHLINDGKRLRYSRFIADMETGTSAQEFNVAGQAGDAIPGPSMLQLRFSDNRGKTYSTPLRQTFGATGEESVQIMFTRLGLSKDRIFEVSWSTPNVTALNGAFIEVEQCSS
jgi:hypothetical protein